MKRFDAQFKEKAVRMVLDRGRPMPVLAREISIHKNTLYKWIVLYKEHKEHAFPGSGHLR